MINSDKETYIDGRKNFFIRLYYYLNQGLSLVNDFKYLVAFIFAVYYTLKLANPMWLVIIFGVCMPLLIFIGWVRVWHVSKVMDWLNIELSTYWNRYTYTLNEKQIALLEEIVKELKKKK